MDILYKCSQLRNVYLHLPFCTKKCHFCAFPIHAVGTDKSLFNNYISNLEKQIKITPYSFSNLQSIYFGGGTPSLFEPQEIEYILSLFPQKSSQTEITLEMNPSQLSKVDRFISIGINRLSVGIQTFNSLIHEDFNRQPSNYEQLLNKMIQLQDFNTNVDFILDFNQQQQEQMMINFIQKAKPKHITLYILQVNEGSYIYNHQQQFHKKYGFYQNYEKISKTLQKINYKHYQVSNFCLPGFETKHNQCYWEGNRSFGAFGMGATSLTNKYRITRPKNLNKYYKYVNQLENNQDFNNLLQIHEEITKNQQLKCIVMSRLRKQQGMKWKQFQPYCSQVQINKIKETVRSINQQKKDLIDEQFLEEGVRMKIPLGYLYADEISYRIILSL